MKISLYKALILFLFGSSIFPLEIPYALNSSFRFFDSIFLAGIPTYVIFSGISFKTTALAPILEFFPIITGPKIWAPDPTITLSQIVGCLLIFL